MTPENINSNEKSIENKKKDSVDMKSIFLKDFKKNITSESDNNKLLDDLFIRNKKPEKLINEKLKDDIVESQMLSKTPKYEGVQSENISLTDLKAKFGADYILLKEKRNNLHDLISSEYDLDKTQSNQLLDEINKLDSNKLSEFIKSDKKQLDFIKSVFGSGFNKFRIDNFPSLYSITKNEYNKKIELLNNEDAKSIKEIFIGFEKGKLDNYSLKELIRTDFLSNVQKKEVIEKLIPNISLKQIKDLNLVSNDEILKFENDLKIKYSDILEGLSINEQEEILKKIKIEDIFIKTSYILNDSNLLTISDKIGFSNVEKDFEKYTEEVKRNIESEGPQDFESFKKELLKLNISGVDNLIEGNSFLRFTIKGKDTFKQNYLRFDKLIEDKNSLSLNMVGSKNSEEGKTKIDLNGEETGNYNFSSLLNLLKNHSNKDKISLEILSKNDFKSLIKNKDHFEVELEGFKKTTKEELDNDEELKEKIKQDLDEKYSYELSELQNDLFILEDELKSVKNNNTSDENDKKSKIDKLELKINKIKLLIKDLEDNLLIVRDGSITSETLVAHKNFNDLLEKINTIDSNGAKLGLKKGIIIETKTGSYEITGISKEFELQPDGSYKGETITLTSLAGDETISYEAFFNGFKEKKAKRIEKLNSFEELLKDNSWNEDYEIKGEKLIQKEVDFNGKKEEKEIEYFISEKGNLIKIESIGNGRVDVVFGEYSEGKQDKKTKETKNKITLENPSTNLSLNELNKIIKDEKFSPDWKVGKKYNLENKDGYQNNINGDFMTRFWSRTSFKELYMAGTILLDGVQEYFKKGNDIKAAEFALRFGSMLPSEVYEDLVAQTEMKGDEAMDKELTALGKISSGKAFNRVKKWLFNKDTPEYKKEAGLMLAAKYGVLYPKNIADYNGTFLWYEALGGKIGDEMYEAEKLKAKKAGLPFDEKELLISLLGAQSGGRLNPKRRSKFYKKFKGAIAGGFGEEYGDGYKDAQDKRNVGDIINGGMAEAKDGTLPNALGWAKRAVEKGGDLKQMNKIYFSLIFSGALLNAPGKVLEELKNHWSGEGNGMILAAFGSDLGGQRIFNKTVVNLSKDMEAIDPVKYKGMSEMAKHIFDKSEKASEEYPKKMERAEDFWNKYGNGLSRALYMADGGKVDLEYAKTDKLIAFGREDKYKDYYNFSKAWASQGSAFKKDFMQDEVGGSGATGINHFNIIKQHFKFTASQTFADIDTILVIWPKIWGDIIATKEKIEIDPNNAYKHKEYLKNKLREISSGLLSTLGKKLYDSLAASDPAGKDLLSIGIDLSKFKDVSYEDVLNGNDGKGTIFDNAVENVVSGNISGKLGIGTTFLTDITDSVQKSVNHTINEEEKQVA